MHVEPPFYHILMCRPSEAATHDLMFQLRDAGYFVRKVNTQSGHNAFPGYIFADPQLDLDRDLYQEAFGLMKSRDFPHPFEMVLPSELDRIQRHVDEVTAPLLGPSLTVALPLDLGASYASEVNIYRFGK